MCVQLFSLALLLDIAVLVPPRTHWYVVRSIGSGIITTSTTKLGHTMSSTFGLNRKRLDFIVIYLCVLIAMFFLKNKKYYSLANCKCFCNLWSHYAQLKTYFIFGIFHVPSPIKLSHKCMASIFNYRLLFTLCATVWPCNLNFNIQLMVRFHFFIKLYCSHLYGIYTLDR